MPPSAFRREAGGNTATELDYKRTDRVRTFYNVVPVGLAGGAPDGFAGRNLCGRVAAIEALNDGAVAPDLATYYFFDSWRPRRPH